jgi:hypothetical protein
VHSTNESLPLQPPRPASTTSKMNNLQQIFQPHQFGPGESSIDLWHVYDDLSQTSYHPGTGIQCGDPNDYFVNAWHIITPKAMRRHLDWRNRKQTQFISFYDNENDARREVHFTGRNKRRSYEPTTVSTLEA